MSNTSETQTPAWMISVNSEHGIALGVNQFREILFRPELFLNNEKPENLKYDILWRDEKIPVLDIHHIVSGISLLSAADLKISFAIFAYFFDKDDLEGGSDEDEKKECYIALPLVADPELITVNDSDACDLPASLSCWQAYTLSCFKHLTKTVPIVDLSHALKSDLVSAA